MRSRLLSILPVITLQLAAATGFLDQELTLGDKVYRYQVYVPREYSSARAWPAILFLHGIGQRGSDGLRQTAIALPDAVRQFPERFPAIVVLPQAPIGSAWLGDSLKAASAALSKTEQDYHIDPERVYLTGISLGGMGAYMEALREPSRFAAIAVLCAALEVPAGPVPPDLKPLMASGAKLLPALSEVMEQWRSHAPLRVYAGGRDTSVPPEVVLRTVDAIRRSGAEVDYRVLPDANHNVWDPVYRDPEFAQWLLRQVRTRQAE